MSIDMQQVYRRTIWDTVWQDECDRAKERSPEFDPADYYTSGRVSKEWPNKENPDWWAKKGPEFVDQWVMWREHGGLTILDDPLGIELEVWAEKDDLSVRSIIDRVMVDANGELYIVDIKTGSSTPAWPMQMALNNLCLMGTHGLRASYAGFWSPRKGGVAKWFDLSVFTPEWLWEQVRMAKEIRDRQLFVAQATNLCTSACGVRQWCVPMGGTPFFRDDATLTHN